MQTKLLIATFVLILSQFAGIAGSKENKISNYEIIIRTSDGTICTRVLCEKKRINLKPDRFYYGYYLNRLFYKQGELQGKPLNGKFSRYDMNENIIESGYFKVGLKVGLWKELSAQGALTETKEYRKGILCGKRIIYKNSTPDIREKYRKGKLIGKPKLLNPLTVPQKSKVKSIKIKNLYHRLFKQKVHKGQAQPEKEPKKRKKNRNKSNTLKANDESIKI